MPGRLALEPLESCGAVPSCRRLAGFPPGAQAPVREDRWPWLRSGSRWLVETPSCSQGVPRGFCASLSPSVALSPGTLAPGRRCQGNGERVPELCPSPSSWRPSPRPPVMCLVPWLHGKICTEMRFRFWLEGGSCCVSSRVRNQWPFRAFSSVAGAPHADGPRTSLVTRSQPCSWALGSAALVCVSHCIELTVSSVTQASRALASLRTVPSSPCPPWPCS